MIQILLTILLLLSAIYLKAQTFKQIWPSDTTFTKFNPSPHIFSFPPLLGSPTPNLNSIYRHLFNFNHNIEIADNIPIAKLDGFDNKPIAKLGGNYTMLVKQVNIDGVSPLMTQRKLNMPARKKPEN